MSKNTRFENMNIKMTFIIAGIFFYLNGCASSSHVITQREVGEKNSAISAAVSIPAWIPISAQGIQSLHTSPKIEIMGVRGIRKGELGLSFSTNVSMYNIIGQGPEVISFGGLFRRYVRIGAVPLKLGWHQIIDIPLSSRYRDYEGYGHHYMPSISSITSNTTATYIGLHGSFHSFDYYWSIPSFDIDKEIVRDNYSGIGIMLGHEQSSYQWQIDITGYKIDEATARRQIPSNDNLRFVNVGVSIAKNFFWNRDNPNLDSGPSALSSSKSNDQANNKQEKSHGDIAKVRAIKTEGTMPIPDGLNSVVLLSGDQIVGKIVDFSKNGIQIESDEIGSIFIQNDKIKTINGIDIQKFKMEISPEKNPLIEREISFDSKLIFDPEEIRRLGKDRIKNLTGMPLHSNILKYGNALSCITTMLLVPINDNITLYYYPSSLGLNYFLLGKIPDDFQYPDEIMNILEPDERSKAMKIYERSLIKELRKKFMLNTLLVLGAGLGLTVMGI